MLLDLGASQVQEGWDDFVARVRLEEMEGVVEGPRPGEGSLGPMAIEKHDCLARYPMLCQLGMESLCPLVVHLEADRP